MYFSEFIVRVKRKDNKDFEPSSLRGYWRLQFSSFNRHLNECKYPVSVIEDVAFERPRKCLEATNKQPPNEEKGKRNNVAEALVKLMTILSEKTPGIFKRRSIDKHTLALQFTAFWSTGYVESIGKSGSGEES